jgi:hypothetical protein
MHVNRIPPRGRDVEPPENASRRADRSAAAEDLDFIDHTVDAVDTGHALLSQLLEKVAGQLSPQNEGALVVFTLHRAYRPIWTALQATPGGRGERMFLGCADARRLLKQIHFRCPWKLIDFALHNQY